MGIIHHANFIKWMEEARTYCFDNLGVSYKAAESEGIFCPVLGVEVKYIKSVRFQDTIRIEVVIIEYKHTKFRVAYEMYNNETNDLVAKCLSTHCFVDKSGHVISLKRINHPFHEMIKQNVKEEN